MEDVLLIESAIDEINNKFDQHISLKDINENGTGWISSVSSDLIDFRFTAPINVRQFIITNRKESNFKTYYLLLGDENEETHMFDVRMNNLSRNGHII